MNNIEKISQEAAINTWPFPKTFAALKKIGVTSYTVEFTDGYSIVYHGKFGEYTGANFEDYLTIKPAAKFSGEEIKKAALDHLKNKTSYMSFLTDIAASGSSHYVVDMLKNTVTYYNPDESQSYQEKVPV